MFLGNLFFDLLPGGSGKYNSSFPPPSTFPPSPAPQALSYPIIVSLFDWAKSSALEWAGAWKGSGGGVFQLGEAVFIGRHAPGQAVDDIAGAQRMAALVVEQVSVGGGR